MKRSLYLECYSGISGDMTVAALLDLGADQKELLSVLQSIPVQGFQIEISRVKKAGIDACDFKVVLDAAHENHDHDMAYLHGHEEKHGQDQEAGGCDHHHEHGYEACCHDHQHEHEHTHAHPHTHSHTHEHRGLEEIRHIIGQTRMTEGARGIALKIFTILAEAESKAHHVPIEEVHFHEVGAVDSIVDIIAAAVCLDQLKVEQVIIPFLCEGHGTVRCQHGILPVPVPATANIMQSYSLPIQFMEVHGEFVTPTGAAIAAAITTSVKLPKQFIVEKIGIGAGKREYERPSMLRAMLIHGQTACDRSGDGYEQNTAYEQNTVHRQNIAHEQQEADGIHEEQDCIYKLESNIDDCSGENLGYVMEQLFANGARDVHYIPVYMKKNRPAYQLNVICSKEDVSRLEELIFRETTTIGIRRQKMERSVLKREIISVQTAFGEAAVKVCELNGEKRYYPEYESVAEICRRQSLPYGEVYRRIAEQAAEV